MTRHAGGKVVATQSCGTRLAPRIHFPQMYWAAGSYAEPVRPRANWAEQGVGGFGEARGGVVCYVPGSLRHDLSRVHMLRVRAVGEAARLAPARLFLHIQIMSGAISRTGKETQGQGWNRLVFT